MQQDSALPASLSPIERTIKFVWGILATVLCVAYFIVLVIIGAAISPFSIRALNAVSRIWSRLNMITAGVRAEFIGLENLRNVGACILVANHESYFDIFALLANMPREIRFVAKKEWLKLPVFGFALKRSDHIVVDRTHGQSIRKALRGDDGDHCIVIFGEGHRYNDGEVHEFKDGAAWLAIQAELPCVPVAINGGSAIFPRGAKIINPGNPMRVTIGKPMITEGMKSRDRKELTRRLENQVRAMHQAAETA